MLYNEFIQGTGCRETDHNYQVYKELEIIYMNTDCTKEHIYEMGKKLVDNSKTEKELELERQINEEIEEHKAEIERYKKMLERDQESLKVWKEDGDNTMIFSSKSAVSYDKEQIRQHRNQINALKWVLA